MKKLHGVIVGVLILCFAPIAQAAKPNDPPTGHFSMFELKAKLSKIILDKCPDSRVTNSVYSITACNAGAKRNTSTLKQPCFDYRVKPRPDSAEFKLNLYVHFDGSHYRQNQPYFASSTTDSLTTIHNRYDLKVLSDQESASSHEVPLGHWAYAAFDELEQAGIIEGMPSPWNYASRNFVPRLLTRYEFAVGVARLIDEPSERAKDTPKIKALIAELVHEFEPEVADLSIRIDANQPTGDAKAWQPRYKYLQLDLSYGKNFDSKLRRKLERTISDYTTQWLKSNSSIQDNAASK